MSARLARAVVLLLAAVALVAQVGPATAAAPTPGSGRPVEVRTTVDGRALAEVRRATPLELVPRPPVPVRLVLHNVGSTARAVRYVRLEGQALGLVLFAYDLGVRVELAPGERRVVHTELDAFDLERQATGYLRAAVRVYDDDRQLLGEQPFALDLRGEPTALLAVLTALVAVLASVALVGLARARRRGRWSARRAVRVGQGALAGAAVGLAGVLAIPLLRVAYVDRWAWAVALVALSGATAAAVLGPGSAGPGAGEAEAEAEATSA